MSATRKLQRRKDVPVRKDLLEGLRADNAALRADYTNLAGRMKVLLGAVAYMMHERERTCIDVTIPGWVWGSDTNIGSVFNDDGSVTVTRDAYLTPPEASA